VVKLRNTGGDVSLYAPEGEQGAVPVPAGGIVDVPGLVLKASKKDEGAELPTDAITVVLPDGEHRAYPTSRWELVKATDDKKD
jgi:hypothetical protein